MPSKSAASNTPPPAVAAKPRPGRKYFTVDEANRSLAYVGRIVEDVVRVYADVQDLRRRIDHPAEGQAVDELERRYESAMDELSGFVDELHIVGVELKDFEKGLVDFPAVHREREIYLCWKRGEQAITHWHEIDAGYAGRQPVAELNKA